MLRDHRGDAAQGAVTDLVGQGALAGGRNDEMQFRARWRDRLNGL